MFVLLLFFNNGFGIYVCCLHEVQCWWRCGDAYVSDAYVAADLHTWRPLGDKNSLAYLQRDRVASGFCKGCLSSPFLEHWSPEGSRKGGPNIVCPINLARIARMAMVYFSARNHIEIRTSDWKRIGPITYMRLCAFERLLGIFINVLKLHACCFRELFVRVKEFKSHRL